MAGFLVIVLIGLGIVTVIRLSGRPKEEDVLERWSALLPGQAISGRISSATGTELTIGIRLQAKSDEFCW